MNDNDMGALLTSTGEDAAINRVTGQSMYSNKGNINVFVIKRDLSRTDTIVSILDYSESLRQKVLEAWNDSEHNVPGAKRPLAETIGSIFVCDGQPAAKFADHIAQDNLLPIPKYSGKIRCFFGAFHCVMKLQNSVGFMFGDVFKTAFSTYRKSDPRIKHIQFPFNNRQRSKEGPEFNRALYGSAAKHYSNHYGVRPSPKQLNDFMLHCAQEYPECMLLLQYSCWVEIEKMMRISEREGEHGNVDLFIASLKLALRIFAATHKTDYVRLISINGVKHKVL
jgi:hypothetical protein